LRGGSFPLLLPLAVGRPVWDSAMHPDSVDPAEIAADVFEFQAAVNRGHDALVVRRTFLAARAHEHLGIVVQRCGEMRGRARRHAGVDPARSRSAHGLQALRHRQPGNARTDHDHVRPVGSRQASNFDHRDIHPERLRIFISHAEFLANNGGAPEQQALLKMIGGLTGIPSYPLDHPGGLRAPRQLLQAGMPPRAEHPGGTAITLQNTSS